MRAILAGTAAATLISANLAPALAQGDEPPPLTIVISPPSGPAREQPMPGPLAAPDTPSPLLGQLRPQSSLEEFTAPIVRTLRDADRGNDGLDTEDIRLATQVPLTEARAGAIAAVLKYDLDGNFIVTRQEIEQVTRGNGAARTKAADALLEKLDWNADDAITLAEASYLEKPPAPRTDQLEKLLAQDPNGDGRLTLDELQAIAEAVFSGADLDRDGLISAGEYKAVESKIQIARKVESGQPCPLPAPPEGAKVLVNSIHSADAVASAWIGGPDQETGLIDVTIEPGKEPLYLVLTSNESTIWRLTGDTGRVARAVVNSQEAALPGKIVDGKTAREQVRKAPERISAAGVIGLPAERVTIVRPDCWRYFSAANGQDAGLATALIERSLGRKPDVVMGGYSPYGLSLPSGSLAPGKREDPPAPEGFDLRMWSDAARFWPGGLVRVDPAEVVAGTIVGPYEVLPSQMGLAQLIGTGAIEFGDGRSFRVVKPIAHLPPSMGGAHSAILVLAKGVPLPPGDPVHACIMFEETGEQLGVTCPKNPPPPALEIAPRTQ